MRQHGQGKPPDRPIRQETREGRFRPLKVDANQWAERIKMAINRRHPAARA